MLRGNEDIQRGMEKRTLLCKGRWPVRSPGLVKGVPAWQRVGMR